MTATISSESRFDPLSVEQSAQRPPRSLQGTLIALSIGVHAALGVGLGALELERMHAATAIELASLPEPQKPPAPAQIEPAPQKPEPARSINRRPAREAAPAPTPEPAAPPPSPADAALDALPDFGLSLNGATGGPGLAVRAPAPAPAQTHATARPRTLGAAPAPTSNECDELASKPEPRSVPPLVPTEEARAAGLEGGKIRVEVTVDETGAVVAARILQGLGYGLDEAALSAAKRAQFAPAQRCGKPVRATRVLTYRLSAG